jgi:sugar phosphate isomerase/epimerase
MKLSISNIAWNDPFDEDIIGILKTAGVQGIEIAPTKIWPDWQGMDVPGAAKVREQVQRHGFSVPALQAVLFARPELMMFASDESRDRTHEHLCRVADVAAALGATAVVFGAPRNRDPLELENDEAFGVAVDFFSRVGAYYESRKTVLCIEANPPQYACRFITDSDQAAALVAAVDSAGVGLHLDAACMAMAGEDPVASVEKHMSTIKHFHISEPDLAGFASPKIAHRAIADVLRANGYSGWASIEMRPQEDAAVGVRQALEFACATYLGY